jgi:Concanavalin A-like lectin/glucanases superfamily
MTVQNSVVFDADSDYLTRTSNIINHNSPYTWMGWVYPVSWASFGHIWGVAAGSEGSGDYSNSDSIGHSNASPGALRLGAVNSGSYTYPEGSNLTASTWTHLTVIRESTTSLKVYINGSATPNITDTQNVGSPSRTSSTFEILGRLNGGYGFRGRIAMVKEWSTALTTTELAAEKDYAYAVKTANLIEVWKFVTGANLLIGSEHGYTWTTHGTVGEAAGPDLNETVSTKSFPAFDTRKRINKLLRF